MATEAVYKYLKNQNRPYSTNDIVQNLHKEFGKTAVQKALDQLVQDEQIKEKVYGKQKVYCVIQDKASDSSQIQNEMTEIDENITKVQESLSSNEEKIKTSEAELKMFNSSLTTEQAEDETEKLTKEIGKLTIKLDDLQKNSVKISIETKKKIENEHVKNMKEYRKRKRICIDIINSILESYPKKKKDLLEEVGIETDEDAGCVLALNK